MDTKNIPRDLKSKKNLSYIIKTELSRNWQLYILLIIPVAYVVIFSYIPMLGLQIAFKSFRISQSMWAAPINPRGPFYQFIRFVGDYKFWEIFQNTIILSFYQLAVSAVMPLFLALVINNLISKTFQKVVQFITYAPHFISMVVMVGILMQILSVRTGFVNNALYALGFERINFIAKPNLFRHLYVWSGVWQETGYSAIVYLAALSGIDPQLHEAATVDGAGRFKRIIHVDIPGIMPTFIILTILAVGRMLDLGFTKAFLFQNTLNISKSQIIDTYLYTMGLGGGVPGASSGTIPDYSYATAIGMTKSLISLVLIISVNKISAKVSDTSLW
ncbi:MAG: ABC transporter permease subunit [Treponema sp.]|nr:ABC transporter permease subunit [Treponema sp.]